MSQPDWSYTIHAYTSTHTSPQTSDMVVIETAQLVPNLMSVWVYVGRRLKLSSPDSESDVHKVFQPLNSSNNQERNL